MVALAAAAAACCLAAGRTVPWQGRQAALTMAGGMLALAVTGGAVVTIAVAGVWVVSAMLGTAGLRGRPEAASCCHRAAGSLAMVLCLFAGGHEPVSPGSHAHGMGLPVLAAAAVGGIALWTVLGRRHGVFTGAGAGAVASAGLRRTTTRTADGLLRAEAWAMTAGLALMWAAHALPV